ncbi:MAG: hypothetical protein GY862_11705 [Gammaproteobacteria bacterium]|nr:hypothetical protein [Gammaproteobacteria bacterium]
MTELPCAVFITALGLEYSSVTKHLSELKEEKYKGTLYETGEYQTPDGTRWHIAAAQTGAGTDNAATQTERAIAHFEPSHVFFTGVAGGIKDVKLGDVVASSKLYGYESGKAGPEKFQSRPVAWQPTHEMQQRAMSIARNTQWLEKLKDTPSPQAYVAPIATGEKVIAGTRNPIYRFIRDHYNDAIAVEMEGSGCFSAAHANTGVHAIVVRGISDLLDNKAQADEQNWQPKAAAHAAAFAFAMLDKIDTGFSASEKTASLPFSKPLSQRGSGFSEKGTESTNPYDPWTPAAPPRFAGRAAQLRELEQALEEKHSVSLVGDWRIGKTSLLNVWKQRARAQGRVAVSVSGEHSAMQSLGRFVEAITGLKSPDEADPAADVLARWAGKNSALPPLVLVDEAGVLVRNFPARFFERLRGMLGEIVLVLASSQDLNVTYEEIGHASPFGNRLKVIRLGLLEAAAADEIIQGGGSLFNEEINELMRIWAGRHPFYLQLLGHHLASAQTTEQALDAFYTNAAVHLRKLWQTLNERDQRALLQVLEGKPVKRRGLRTRGLVTKDGQLFGKILQEWLEEEFL